MRTPDTVRRFDFGEIRAATRTAQGFLVTPAFVTRCGVFPYMDGKGKVRRELRHPDDVFAPESLKTLKYVPTTIEHPPVLLTPDNVAKYRVGHATERVEVNRDMLDADLIWEDKEAIQAIEDDGLREVSCGYDCKVIPEEGVYEGTPYNFRQKGIVYNHVAAVKRGRAGPEIRMRIDSSDAVMVDADPEKPLSQNEQESTVQDADIGAPSAVSKKVIILGREVDLPSDVADVIQDFKDRFDEMRARLAQLEETMSTRMDTQDVDINQPGVSPQVKVEQQGPDGRAAGGKTAAKPGTITGPVGKTDAEAEEEKKKADKAKKDAEEMDKANRDAAEALKNDASSGLEAMRHDAEEMQKKADEAKAKYDEAAAASMNKPEKKPDAQKMDSADYERRVRVRAKLERQAEKLVPFEVAQKFDSMTDGDIMSAVIKHRNPHADLKEKSETYLQTRFDSVVEAMAEDSAEARRKTGAALLETGARMDGRDGGPADPAKARLKMISDSRALHTQHLSASKK